MGSGCFLRFPLSKRILWIPLLLSNKNPCKYLKYSQNIRFDTFLLPLKFIFECEICIGFIIEYLAKYAKNTNRFRRNVWLMDYHKASAILQPFRLIRNRAFHFENLYKFTDNGYPRLNVKITNKYKESVYIAIEPSKIITFLDDLIVSFDKDLIDYAKQK